MRKKRLGFLAVFVAVVLSAVGGAVAPVDSAAREMKLPPVSRTELDNGLVLLSVRDERLPLVNIRLGIWGGSASDPEGLEGLCDLTATLVRKGAGPLSTAEFAEKVESMGGRIESWASKDYTVVSAEFLAKDFEEALELVGDVVMRPGFDPDEFSREKTKVLGRLAQVPDDPFDLADREFSAFLLGDHPYGHPTDGTIPSVGRIGLDDVRSYHESFYRPQRSVLAVIGDVDPEDAKEAVERIFSGWERGGEEVSSPPPEAAPGGRRILLVDKPDATQTQIRIGNPALSKSDEDYAALYAANVLFGGGFTSRLVDEIRVNRGLSYSPHSRLYTYASGGVFVIKEYTRNELAMETIEITLGLVRDLREKGVSEDELAKTKSYIRGLFPLRLETPESLAENLVEMELYGLGEDYLTVLPKRVEELTVEDVERVARKYMAFDDFTFTVVGVADSLRGPLAAYGPVEVKKIGPAEE